MQAFTKTVTYQLYKTLVIKNLQQHISSNWPCQSLESPLLSHLVNCKINENYQKPIRRKYELIIMR